MRVSHTLSAPFASPAWAVTCQQFVDRAEPVAALVMRVSLRELDLGVVPDRDYYVRRASDGASRGAEVLQAYVSWSEQPWPPVMDDAQNLAMALAEALGVNTVETFLSFINANDQQRTRLLALAGAATQFNEVTLADEEDVEDVEQDGSNDHGAAKAFTDGRSTEPEPLASMQHEAPDAKPEPQKVPLYRFEDLRLDGEPLRIAGDPRHQRGSVDTSETSSHHDSTFGSGADQPRPRAGSGTDLSELDRLGMRVTIAFEQSRLGGGSVAVLPGDPLPGESSILVVDVSSPALIDEAKQQSRVVRSVFESLGLSSLFPGFDVLTIVDGEVDRMIELKSSGFDARVQEMSWNEWKTASGDLRDKFWLYLVGNLRSDLQDASPFVRAVHDPFGTLESSAGDTQVHKRVIQLRVREFAAADQLTLGVSPRS